MQDPHSLFNPLGMPNMMAGMFEASFPKFPNMFDQSFGQQDMFGTPFHPMPATGPASASSQMPKAASTARAAGERIIPIQVVKSNSADLAPQKPQVIILDCSIYRRQAYLVIIALWSNMWVIRLSLYAVK
jgi:hypothetical protein